MFIQLHPSMILINGFLMFLIGGYMFVSIGDPLLGDFTYKKFNKIITWILWYGSLLMVIEITITYNRHWITFKENHIYVPSDWRFKRNRQQYRVEVCYNNIADVSFIRSTKSSKNKTIQEESFNPLYHQYMVLHLRNGRKERIKLDFYSKKQKVKILEELERRLIYCGNNIDLTNAKESLRKLGMFGAKLVMDIVEKYDRKKINKKSNAKKQKDEESETTNQ